MIHARYHDAFVDQYPNYGPNPLMVKFGITRIRANRIASDLGIRRLPREERTCWTCHNPMKGLPEYTGNYCAECFNIRRKDEEAIPVLHLRTLFHRAKNRATVKDIPFNITQDHLNELWHQQGQRCFYSDVVMETDGRVRDPHGVSIDRVFPEKGYTLGNVVLCCWGVNTAKQDFSLSEFVELCRNVAHNPKLDSRIKSFYDVDPKTHCLGSSD